MPAVDSCQPQVVAALAKAGYRVTDEPYTLRIGIPHEPVLYADLRLVSESEPNRVIIVVEVKCFSNSKRILDDLYNAVGQCAMYREVLEDFEPDAVLYLAVPHEIYESELSGYIVTRMLQRQHLRLITVDLASEEVVSWIV